MIKQVESGNIHELSEIAESYIESLDVSERQPTHFIEQIKSGVESKKAEVYGWYDDTNIITGFSIAGLVSNRVSIVYVSNVPEKIDTNTVHQIERALFDVAFRRLQEVTSYIRAGGGDSSENLISHMLRNGFRRFDRAGMTLSKVAVENLESPTLQEGYSFKSYQSEMRKKISELLFASNADTIDTQVFPEFFKNLEVSYQLIERIENSIYGKYTELQSKIIEYEEEIVGVCFLSFRGEDTGYIPEITISPAHKRNGLGRALLTYSLQELVNSEEKTAKIDLDVTLTNPALKLYQSLGFQETTTYSMFSWTK